MKNFFASIFKNWQTTILGIGTLSAVGAAAYAHPSTLAEPTTITSILAGLGLILAPDAAKTVLTTDAAPAATATEEKK